MVWDKERVIVLPYDGYLSSTRLFVIIRVLSDYFIDWEKESRISLLGSSLKRFYTNEIPNVDVEVRFMDQLFLCKTNSEGFATIDVEWPNTLEKAEILPIHFKITNIPQLKYKVLDEVFDGRIFFMGLSPKVGVITDIDDTILHTNVLSKVRMVWNSVLLSPQKRKAITKSSHFLKKLTVEGELPIFYLSNSPYNLYRYLARFLLINKYPEGPLFLRDFGRRNTTLPSGYTSHKNYKISKLLESFPDTNFILIGDGAEHDPDIYLDIKKKHKERILGIFLRLVGDNKKQTSTR